MITIKARLSVSKDADSEALLEKITAALGPYLGNYDLSDTVKHGEPRTLVYLDLVEPEHAITKNIRKKKHNI